LSISNDVRLPNGCRTRLRRAIRAALALHGVTNGRIRVRLTGDADIAQLNEYHLGHEGPTDVLTFDLRDRDDLPLDVDIAISVDVARRAARKRGHDPALEVALYGVHGVLHLLGYRDKTLAAAAKMHQKEDEIFESLGWGRVFAAT
jgi:probable rRNA maturation factor